MREIIGTLTDEIIRLLVTIKINFHLLVFYQGNIYTGYSYGVTTNKNFCYPVF